MFHLDFLGNRLLIAVIAVVHVCINHPMAVGAMPLITLMEWWGHKTGDARWDALAYRLLRVCFIVTTSLGALTGVGIWFSLSVVNPYAIGSLIRVFYWAWFSEWVVFVSEVVLIISYYLLWKKWEKKKSLHIALGVALSIASWLTMAIIVAILGYMMDVGSWTAEKSLLSGVLNPIYLPQLAFRTPLAMMTAGLFMLFLTYFFTEKRSPFQASAARWIAIWSLVWLPFCLAGGIWYWNAVPSAMSANLNVAIGTQIFENQYGQILSLLNLSTVVTLVVLFWALVLPAKLPRVVLLIPFIVALVALGFFERTREFIRKPYVIAGYMYANGIRVADYPLLNQEGVLPHSAIARVPKVTEENVLIAGEDVFMIACSRCHTTNGVNSVLDKLGNLYGPGTWDRETVQLFIRQMHNARPFMPPFPGNDAELGALTDYLISLRKTPLPVNGAQTAQGEIPAPIEPADPRDS